MWHVAKNVLAPIVSLAIFILGGGLFHTFVSVRLGVDGHPNAIIGSVAAAFAVGVVVGSRYCDSWIGRVGHIRAFAACASAAAATVAIQGIFLSPWVWIPMRFFAGLCSAGLYICVESWLLHASSPTNRGRVLSLYMIAFYVAQASGQLLLNLGEITGSLLFSIPVILICLSVWPVSMTKSPSPPNPEVPFIGLKYLYRISPVGIAGALVAGMIVGSFYSLGPIFIQEAGLSVPVMAYVMAVTIFGGFSLQWPIGYLSDRIDRRIVLVAVSLVTTMTALLIIWVGQFQPWSLLALFLVFGGFSFTIYPLSISHTSDRMDPNHLVATTASLLLIYGLGSITGPLVAPLFMTAFGAAGLMVFIATSALALSAFVLWRSVSRKPVPADEKGPFVTVPRTGPLSAELVSEEEVDAEISNIPSAQS